MANINLDQIRALINSGAHEEARDQLIDVLYENYDDLAAWLLLTECAHDRTEYKRAIREALRIAPSNPTARRLAMDLAQQVEPSGEGRQRHAANRAIQSLFNLLLLLVIIGVGTGIVFLLIGEPRSDIDPTAIPAVALDQQCAASIENTSRLLEARCSFQALNTACIANPSVSFEPQPIGSQVFLAGDRIGINQLSAIETGDFVAGTDAWGLAILQPSNTLQIIVTSSVRLSDFNAAFTSFNFRSSPIPSPCDALPPSGVLMTTRQSPTNFTINGLSIVIDGAVFAQIDVAAGLRFFVLDGLLVIQNETFRESEAVQIDVNSLLQAVDDPSLARDNVIVRGKLENLTPLLTYTDPIIAVAANATPTLTPSATPTAGIRILSPTPTSRIPLPTSTPRPTQTATNTPIPTSTDIPSSSGTSIPTPPPIIVTESLPETITFDRQAWDCRFLIDDVSVQYQIIFEPVINQIIAASGILPQYNNTVVLLVGEQYQSVDQLGPEWARIPSYVEGEQWLLLRENDVLYTSSPDSYIADGIFRFVIQSDGISGGIFSGTRLIGIVQQCSVQN